MFLCYTRRRRKRVDGCMFGPKRFFCWLSMGIITATKKENGENWTAELTGRRGQLNRVAPPPPRQDRA